MGSSLGRLLIGRPGNQTPEPKGKKLPPLDNTVSVLDKMVAENPLAFVIPSPLMIPPEDE